MADPLEGKTGVDRTTGQRVVRQGGAWVPIAPPGGKNGKPPVQEASMRGRMDIGLAPMVQANADMEATERKGNPYSLTQNPGNAIAKTVSSVGLDIPAMGVNLHPFDGVAKAIGGQDFQGYEQAAKAFEAQLMPIMSGAAVSPSEAARQIKSALPELGDSPETLQTKARTRQMMLNGAAKARGIPLPYPKTETWGINSMRVPTGGPAAAGGATPNAAPATPGVRRYNPKTGKIE